jgi:hypothetical protein
MKKTEIADPTKRAWYAMALRHGQAHASFCQILDSDQVKAWAGYFALQGWFPWNFGVGWTAPCRWPDELAP